MAIIIRDVNKEIYAKFKAKAAEYGLKIGEALTKAMESWMNLNNTLTDEEFERRKNLATYRSVIRDLEKSYPQKWGLISNGDLQCIKNTHEEIVEEIKSRNLIGKPCYIFQIGRRIVKRTFGMGSRIK